MVEIKTKSFHNFKNFKKSLKYPVMTHLKLPPYLIIFMERAILSNCTTKFDIILSSHFRISTWLLILSFLQFNNRAKKFVIQIWRDKKNLLKLKKAYDIFFVSWICKNHNWREPPSRARRDSGHLSGSAFEVVRGTFEVRLQVVYQDYITSTTDCVLPLKSFFYINELDLFPKPIHPRSNVEVSVDDWMGIILHYLEGCKNRIATYFLELLNVETELY